MIRRPALLAVACGVCLTLGAACRGRDRGAAQADVDGDTLVLYLAASLTRAMRPALDSFSARTGIVVLQESGASLEQVRKVTELGRVPDLLILADEEVFPRYLAPRHVTQWTSFARNRMTIAYTATSKHHGEITAANWFEILARSDVQVGRTDPETAPAGYRTLLMMSLAERHYDRAGLKARLLANAPARNIRGNAAELATLLAAGELDFIYEYRSLAVANGFSFLDLPAEIDLGDPAHAAGYAGASVVLRGGTADSMRIAGAPILYAFAIPVAAPHAASARRFDEFLRSADARALLRAAHVDMLGTVIEHRASANGVDAR